MIRIILEFLKIRGLLKTAYNDGNTCLVIYGISPMVVGLLEKLGYRLPYEPHGIFKTTPRKNKCMILNL